MLLISGAGAGFQLFGGLPTRLLNNTHPPHSRLSAGEPALEICSRKSNGTGYHFRIEIETTWTFNL